MSLPRYPKYKDSGVEWLGEVPEHWSVDRFKWSVASCRNGIWGDEPLQDGNDIPCVRVADFDRDRLQVELTEPTVLNVTPKERAGRVLEPGNLLLEKAGGGELQPVGFVVLYDDSRSAVCSNFIARMSLADQMDSSYWRYAHAAAYAVRLNTRSIKQTSGIQNLDQQQYLDELAPFPPISEQKSIARFLDRETAKIDALIAEQQRLVELLKEKRQAVISHAVTKGLNPGVPLKPSGIEWLGDVPAHWLVGKCGLHVSVLSGFAFPSNGFSEDESAVRLLRGINVGVSRLKWNETVFWRRTEDDGLDQYELMPGDLVIGMDRPLIAEGVRVAKVTADDVPCLLLQRVASLKCGTSLNVDFLHALISSEMFVAHFAPDVTGVSVPHISPEQIGAFEIPVPPLAEQAAIAAVIGHQSASLGALVAEAQSAIGLLKQRKTTLIACAVTGRIDVTAMPLEQSA